MPRANGHVGVVSIADHVPAAWSARGAGDLIEHIHHAAPVLVVVAVVVASPPREQLPAGGGARERPRRRDLEHEIPLVASRRENPAEEFQ